mmetsp:Transcript_2966/g.12152  ORF Transcript_2966/g.12152 Transcript_2966/m.12152 type:complete len:450 (-) Transcript_2966:1633-2982(-)
MPYPTSSTHANPARRQRPSVQSHGPAQHLLLAKVRLKRRHPLPQLRDALSLLRQHPRQPVDVLIDRAAGFVDIRQQRHLGLDELHRLLDLPPVRGDDLLLLLQDDVDQVVVRLDHLVHVDGRSPSLRGGGRLGGRDGRGRRLGDRRERCLDARGRARGRRRRRRGGFDGGRPRGRRRRRPRPPRRPLRRPWFQSSKVPAPPQHLGVGRLGVLAGHARHLGRHLGRLLRLGSSSPLLRRLATAIVGGGFALGGVGAVLGVNPRVERLRPRVRGGLLLLRRGERGGSLGRREGERGRSRERRRGRRALGPGSAPSLGIRSAPPVAPVAGCLRGGRREVRRVQRRAARDGGDAVGGELTGNPRDARVSLEPGPFAAKLLDAICVAKGVERVLARAGGWGDVGDHHRARVPQERVPEHLREFAPAERHVVRAHVQRADALLERQERLVDLGTL